MNIVIDAFGGDNAPLEVIKGSIDATLYIFSLAILNLNVMKKK